MSRRKSGRCSVQYSISTLVIAGFLTVAECCTPFGKDSLLPSTVLGSSSSFSSETPSGGPVPMSRDLFSNRALGGQTHLRGKPPMTIALGTSSAATIHEAHDLNCFDFDVKCRWRNVEGIFVDELDWFQGSGQLDQGRLQVATATHVAPDGMYAIVATDTVQLPTAKAVLVSDPILCQLGDGEIQFLYWTSPEVRMKVCVKKTVKVFPDFDFCSAPIEAGDPGPAYVTIPDQGRTPFQLFIMAENFVFNAVNLQGGFAIIDSIEYFARMCPTSSSLSSTSSPTPLALPRKLTNSLAAIDDLVPFGFGSRERSFGQIGSDVETNDVEPLIPFGDSPSEASDSTTQHTTQRRSADGGFPTLAPDMGFVLGVPKSAGTKGILPLGDSEDQADSSSAWKESNTVDESTEQTFEPRPALFKSVMTRKGPAQAEPAAKNVFESLDEFSENIVDAISSKDLLSTSVCDVLVCSFNDTDICTNMADQSGWTVTNGTVGNPLTGIRGDASAFPYNREGWYAFVSGPQEVARLQTPSFVVDRPMELVFSYHKVDKRSTLTVNARREKENDETSLFTAPELKKTSRRWYREVIALPVGVYDYLAFDVTRLGANHHVGIDELFVVDERRKSFCGK